MSSGTSSTTVIASSTGLTLLPLFRFSGLYDSIKPVVLVGALEGNFFASFALGWAVTTGAGLASYPLDTIRRRMMMTSGAKVHYKSMFDAGSQIIKTEGAKSLFKGAGANILRGVAG